MLFDIGNVLLKFDFNRAARAMAGYSNASAQEIRLVLDSWQHRHETGTVTSDEFSAGLREELDFSGTEVKF